MGNTATNALGGVGHGLLGMFGIGSVYDPVAPYRAQLSQSISDMNNMVADSTVAALQTVAKVDMALYTDLNLKDQVTTAREAVQNDILWNSIDENRLYITFLMFAIVILLYFMLTQKNVAEE